MTTAMTPARTALLTCIAMVAFAANSLLCRLALRDTAIDAQSFTTLRLASGALTLWMILRLRSGGPRPGGSWPSALALLVYAAGFSFAYRELSTATGALLLFGAVQLTMIGAGIAGGERPGPIRIVGLLLALGGVVWLLLPGVSAPPPGAAAFMIAAGIGWGIYSLRGRGSPDPTADTARNFLRAMVPAGVLSALLVSNLSIDPAGAAYAVASGALASGIGYAIWYAALPGLLPTTAATAQLSVPILAAIAGVALAGESATLRLFVSGAATLGGIALVLAGRQLESRRAGPT